MKYVEPDGTIREYQGVTPIGAGGHIDVPLSNFASMAFAADDNMFIGEQVLPSVPVQKQSDKFFIHERSDWFRIPNTQRARLSRAHTVEFRVSSDSYFAENYALGALIPLEDLDNADNPIGIRRNHTQMVTHLLRLDQEQRIANLVTSASNVGSGVTTPGSQESWFNPDSADIIGQVQTAHAFIRSETGLLPNLMVVDWDSWQAALRNVRLHDRFKHVGNVRGILTPDQIAPVFGVDRILVGRAISNTGAEQVGSENWTSGNVWGNTALLAHVSMRGAMSATYGTRFRWQPGGLPAPFAVQRKREDGAGSRRAEIVEALYWQDEQIIAPELAYVIKTSSGETGAP